ncbi:hypothetical protein SKAU_G00176890 [Synaphobranchus kaupii]|uniref:Testis expressed 264, ER-phagy receptor n=1 Tax=Synaphobranchus kaupii TaxID=118154 RepID=A0A9Q1FM42_SYNKA|nr:hypothetical protein SKAU_G00176890 [Synaphobranchus kaupii]
MSDFVILALIVFLLLSLLVTIVGFILYSGLLSEVGVRTGSPPIKNITIAYKFKEGPYKECGSIFTESCSIGPKLHCIGVYYDDPKTVPAEKCRCAVGNILSEGEEKPEEELVRLYEKFGFKIFSFPEVTHVVSATFPNRTSLSFLLGIYKVYPQLSDYIKCRHLDSCHPGYAAGTCSSEGRDADSFVLCNGHVSPVSAVLTVIVIIPIRMLLRSGLLRLGECPQSS